MISENKKKEYINTELAVLDGVITYADRMIFDEGQNEYGFLRRHAYGKTVVIETERKGTLVFRLSSTSVTYPNAASGYATLHSPVGRLCSFVRPGDEDETPVWGEYRVVETRLFERFDGVHFEDNIRNFLRMTVNGDFGNAQVTDLKHALATKVPRRRTTKADKVLSPELETSIPSEVIAAEEEPAQTPLAPIVELTPLQIIEDDEELASSLDLDDFEEYSVTEASDAEDYFGLSEVFYVNRTREQDQIISRTPLGPMFVEGVAGSGKTSAALGRTKMLCDFNVRNVVDEADFRQIVGESLDYWSGKYAGQFSQESSIGFVRTGELIQYLKETCRRIDLPNLPVAEYKELQSRLRAHRNIERSSMASWRWSGLPEPRASYADTTMAWLYATDRAVAGYFTGRMITSLPSAEDIGAYFDPGHRGKALRLAKAAVEHLQEELKTLVSGVNLAIGSNRFALDGLAVRVYKAIQNTRQHVLSKDVLWFMGRGITLFAEKERDMAEQLIRAQVPLFLRSGERLIFVGENGPLDDSLTLITSLGEPLSWNEQAIAQLRDGKLVVRDAVGHSFRAKCSDVDDLFFKLLPEAIDKPYQLTDGKLKPLVILRGLGRERLNLASYVGSDIESDEEQAEAVQDNLTIDVAPEQKFRSVDSLLNTLFRKVLLHPLTYVADAYLSALAESSQSFPDSVLAQQILTQLQSKKLADEDIDLLLCLAHLIGRGFDQKIATLTEPKFYQSVFIDEVQDFTEQQIYLMAEQARPEYRAVTVVGDIAQKLHHDSKIDIRACFPSQTLPHVRLTENIRQMDTPGLAWFSACFRAELQDEMLGIEPKGDLLARLKANAGSIRGPEIVYCNDNELDEAIINALRQVRPGHTAAVIFPNSENAAHTHQRLRPKLAEYLVDTELSEKVDLSRRHLRHFTSVLNAKGLEFDTVILPYIDAYDLDLPSHVNRLYVGLTRARKKLLLLSSGNMSPKFDKVLSRYEEGISKLCPSN